MSIHVIRAARSSSPSSLGSKGSSWKERANRSHSLQSPPSSSMSASSTMRARTRTARIASGNTSPRNPPSFRTAASRPGTFWLISSVGLPSPNCSRQTSLPRASLGFSQSNDPLLSSLRGLMRFAIASSAPDPSAATTFTRNEGLSGTPTSRRSRGGVSAPAAPHGKRIAMRPRYASSVTGASAGSSIPSKLISALNEAGPPSAASVTSISTRS